MLNQKEFDHWCRQISISQEARSIIEEIRSREPIRRVKSSGINVRGDYPSRKMGKTIQFESHKVELPGIEEYEEDSDVLEYYDQPYQFTLEWKSSSGKIVRASHIPDFFVLRTECAGFEEWKPETRLEKLAAKQPQRYVYTEDGRWQNLPALAYAEKLGLYYRIRLDTEIDWIKYRNRLFLKAYTQPLHQLDSVRSGQILEMVRSHPGITYWELLNSSEVDADEINVLIATGKIYIDLSAAPLAEPEKVLLFTDQPTAYAYSQMIDSVGVRQIFPLPTESNSPTGLKNNSLVSQTRISAGAMEHFLKASPSALREANRKYQVIEPYLNGAKHSDETETVPKRTIARWKAQFKRAQASYGCGYVGLIDRQMDKGNRLPKIPPEAEEFMEKIIEEHYETIKQKGKLAVYGTLAREWEKAGRSDKLPSYATFNTRIKKRSGYQQTQKRSGSRAAYQQSPFYWELKLTTPRHGDRPFEIAHIDHTQLDIELVCSHTGKPLGRPWATVLIDAMSRRILAVYLTFDEPSYRSCMMVLRICVQRFSRLPETIVVDGGAEFGSTYFETLLAAFGCTKKQRPAGKARFGSIIERLFGTTNTEFFHNLRGNTQISKNVRLVTKANNPKRQAVWTLDELYSHFCAYSYEFYDCQEHPALLQSPRQAFTNGLTSSGDRRMQEIVYDENFKIFTLPSTRKGTAKVQPSKGVKINYLYYWSTDEEFLSPEIEGTNVPIRYDPFDLGTAYAYVKGHWVRCISQYYSSFHDRSEREVKLASVELHRSKQKQAGRVTLSAKEKAAYLEGTEAKEALLLQRLHDLARQDVCALIEGSSTEKSHQNRQFSLKNPECLPEKERKGMKSKSRISIDLNKIEAYKDEELW